MLLVLVVLGSYLLGSVPFGYLVGRARGVDVMKAGSGNIGATNVGRLCGFRWGALVFLLDFAKGALPVFLAGLLEAPAGLLPQALPVAAGVAAFVGHLLPIYLGFKGGKGVATGAGVIAVLVPQATVIVLAAWGAILWWTRYVSLASLLAAALLLALRLTLYSDPWSKDGIVVTLFCVVGTALVFARHHANIRRLIAGTERRIREPEA